MSQVTFLGVGSAFNYYDECNSCYFRIDNNLVFIDMGERIATKIIASKLLDDITIENIYVLITHTHIDHVGSLEPLLTYLKIFKKFENVTLIYPKMDTIRTLFEISSAKLNYKTIEDINIDLGFMKVQAIPEVHIDHSYGYIINSRDYNFYYSGDTNTFSEKAYSLLKEGRIDTIYHEVASASSPLHIGLEELANKVEKNDRSKFVLMHFASNELKEKCLSLGFNVGKAIEVNR